jgi:hypothetical protein
MARALKRSMLAALGLATVLAAILAGCAPGPVIDGLPSSMALPAGAPARPATPYEYPAVHDMPPPRTAPTMNEEQQLKLEKELTAVRERQKTDEGTAKKTAPPAKKKPTAANDAQTGGAKANP